MNDHQSETAGDRLTTLPAELLHRIFSYLFPTHSPERAKYVAKEEKPCSHPLDYVAATNKRLRCEVSEWALHFLLTQKSVTKYQLPKSAKAKSHTASHLRGRRGLLSWSATHCIFCGTKCSRSAILMNGFRCCKACDKAQWDKITRTEAKKRYGLKDDDLFPNANGRISHPDCPKPRYGIYMCQGGRTAMFLLEDVEHVATLIHGNLQAYLAKRAQGKATGEEYNGKQLLDELDAAHAAGDEEGVQRLSDELFGDIPQNFIDEVLPDLQDLDWMGPPVHSR